MKIFILCLIVGLSMMSVVSAGASEPITGLVIDSRGYDLIGEYPLQILDSRGLIVNSLVCISPSWITKSHPITYYQESNHNTITEGKSRVGSNYLTVKAVAVKSQGRSIVISLDDADKILSHREMKDIFEKGNIVILN